MGHDLEREHKALLIAGLASQVLSEPVTMDKALLSATIARKYARIVDRIKEAGGLDLYEITPDATARQGLKHDTDGDNELCKQVRGSRADKASKGAGASALRHLQRYKGKLRHASSAASRPGGSSLAATGCPAFGIRLSCGGRPHAARTFARASGTCWLEPRTAPSAVPRAPSADPHYGVGRRRQGCGECGVRHAQPHRQERQVPAGPATTRRGEEARRPRRLRGGEGGAVEAAGGRRQALPAQEEVAAAGGGCKGGCKGGARAGTATTAARAALAAPEPEPRRE